MPLAIPFQISRDHRNVPPMSPDVDRPCLLCKKPIADLEANNRWVRINMNGQLITGREAKLFPNDDLGCFPVGPECWERVPDQYRSV